MNKTNELTVEFPAAGENESLARIIVSAYVAKLNPTIEELSDLKVAVSEAVTNAIIHGYDGQEGRVRLVVSMEGRMVTIQIIDYGCGISDIEKAMEPLYTTKPEQERSGMGFSFMEAFTNELQVQSVPGEGTTITMKKLIGE
jgi:stage II sporulation protein AB (anti-sigma F factor)